MIKTALGLILILLVPWVVMLGESVASDRPSKSIDAINNACYDNRAEYWNRFPFPEALSKMVKKYGPKVGGKVLDIGSGTGVLAKWLQDAGFDVLCLDPSDEMVRRCRKMGLKTSQVRIQDFETDQKFAMVFAILSLIHVPKDEMKEQIEKIANMLDTEAVFFVGMISGRSEGIEEGSSGYSRFFSKYTKEEYSELLNPYFSVLESYLTNGNIKYFLLALRAN